MILSCKTELLGWKSIKCVILSHQTAGYGRVCHAQNHCFMMVLDRFLEHVLFFDQILRAGSDQRSACLWSIKRANRDQNSKAPMRRIIVL